VSDSPTATLPPTPARPLARTIGGIAFEDPYAWLEEDTPETLAWQAAQSAATVAHLERTSVLAWLREHVADYLSTGFVMAPRRCGEHWFALRFAATGPQLAVGAAPDAADRVLIDPATIEDPRGPASLDWYHPSPDGRYVAYGISFGGDEQSVLHVIEVESGRVLPDRVPFCSSATVAWLPDSSAFFHSAGLKPDFEDTDKHLFLHRLGQTEPSAPEPVRVREPHCVMPQVSGDGRWLVAVTSELDSRPDHIRELPDGAWRPFLEGMEGSAFGFFDGEDYVCVSTHGAPNGRLVRIPVATARDMETWVELVPESDELVMKTVAQAGTLAVIAFLRDAYAELRVVDLDGRHVADVELPGRGAVLPTSLYGMTQPTAPQMGQSVYAAPGEFTFVFATPTRSPSICRYDIAAGRLEELQPPLRTHDDYVVEELSTTAPDGATVRCKLVRRRDVDPGTPGPTLLYGYGGWNVSFVPSYPGAFAAFLDAGATLALAHLRGGSEYGAAQWEDGRLAHKQRTFDDVYAIAEALIAERRTTPEQLALVGVSNGGLTVGAAVTQRPELFRAAAAIVPLDDMLRFDRDPYTATCAPEYGDPHDPQAARWLHAYSPVHNVRPAAYPATLLYCGEVDVRCWPWHARKLAAALQAANDNERPILFRAAEGGGHGTVMLVPDQVAEWVAFLMDELGLDPRPR